jgi:hypothetical protein
MNRKAAAGGVACNPATIDAAADDGKVIGRSHNAVLPEVRDFPQARRRIRTEPRTL